MAGWKRYNLFHDRVQSVSKKNYARIVMNVNSNTTRALLINKSFIAREYNLSND